MTTTPVVASSFWLPVLDWEEVDSIYANFVESPYMVILYNRYNTILFYYSLWDLDNAREIYYYFFNKFSIPTMTIDFPVEHWNQVDQILIEKQRILLKNKEREMLYCWKYRTEEDTQQMKVNLCNFFRQYY